jgi:hypothetical protein
VKDIIEEGVCIDNRLELANARAVDAIAAVAKLARYVIKLEERLESLEVK